MTDLNKLAAEMPANVRRWVMRGGAVPDAVWFGSWSHLKRHVGGKRWERTELCQQLRAALNSQARP